MTGPAPKMPVRLVPDALTAMAASSSTREPGEFCSKAEHGETGVAGDGKTITCTDVNGRWRWED